MKHLPDNNQSASVGDRAHRDDVTSGEKQDGGCCGGPRVYPLYCVVCHVTLNGGEQAREHFEGRTHARRLRLTSSSSSSAAAAAAEQRVSVLFCFYDYSV